MILGEGKKQSSTGEARALCMNGEINLSLSDRPLAFSAPLEKGEIELDVHCGVD